MYKGQSKILYWNHNSAYYDWVKRKIGDRKRILDVGCGDGTLAHFLEETGREIIGLDPDETCINTAKGRVRSDNIHFIKTSFEEFVAEQGSFDAIVFVASLHHMEAELAIEKATRLLCNNGILLIVGLSHPSSISDWIIEGLRVIPSLISSKVHRMQSSESLNIPTSYQINNMAYIRQLIDRNIPGANLRRALHYRYLVSWEKRV